jgi:WXG100 family type VII secretion target
MVDYIQIVADEVSEHISTIQNQAKVFDDARNKLMSDFSPIQGGEWKGESAEAFKNFMLTKYMPTVLRLIAAISGMGGGVGQGLDRFLQADTDAASVASNLVGELNIF